MMNVQIDKNAVDAFCERYHVRKLAIFGSVLRDDFRPDSDVDVLIDFVPGTKVGLKFIDLQDELTAMFGRKVDLNTPGFLSPRIREKVTKQAEVIYERA